ncbi:hypothetical protein A8B82_00020 [Sulfitobacter sp. EhC04]|uniref:hypothetical protein n=1 Tax=Sulfitobacter sp. EhC04 TaxID=1849168 RepID=UPI0007F3F126|nr:hypothetical protein [Sulfitobacter sp. EhC04]OAN80475.1 hypothetical protein A8B82_00020 [Sulfitobacter sp. EhC04]
MILLAFIYILLAFGALAALCIMILRIGAMIGTCPQTSAAARAAAVTIATGFAAIGAGGVTLIGALLPLAASGPLISFLLALGLASLCLGLGFTHAVGTLRAVLVRPAQDNPRQQPEPA